jgi:hypothetical protein
LNVELGARLHQQQRENKRVKTAGLVLIVIGAIALIWGGITYTTRDQVVDVGPLHASVEKEHHVPFSPIAGAVLLVGGIALMAVGRK